MTTTTLTTNPRPADVRYAIEQSLPGVWLAWTWDDERPASSDPWVPPLAVADVLCTLAGDRASVGAIHHYVWMLAYAQTRATAALALRQLASLLDGCDVPRDPCGYD